MFTLEQDLSFSKALKHVSKEKEAMLEKKNLKIGMWISSRVVSYLALAQ